MERKNECRALQSCHRLSIIYSGAKRDISQQATTCNFMKRTGVHGRVCCEFLMNRWVQMPCSAHTPSPIDQYFYVT
eukprot:scaffold182332_cov51-Prasinocladus_malaysianus.AAC.1